MKLKRITDIFLALILAIPAVVFVLIAMLLIWITTRSSPIFIQTRVGLNEQPFQLYKLRTMRPNTPDRASHEVAVHSITPIGALLRRTKIDELPQVWSVLLGDMSFVGPRPCLPVQVELIAERAKRGVFNVRPGITGLAQISGVDMSQPVQLSEVDAEYISRSNFRLDARILLATLSGRGIGDAVKAG